MTPAEFSEFLDALRKPDDSAWLRLVSEFDGALRQFANSAIRDLGLRPGIGSADLAQTVYRRLLVACRTTHFASMEEVRRWMFRVLLNRATDLARVGRLQSLSDREVEVSDVSSSGPPATTGEQDELRLVMDALPEEQRRCAQLKYIDGLSWAEVAIQVRGNPQCAHALQVKFTRKLREVLRSLGLMAEGTGL